MSKYSCMVILLASLLLSSSSLAKRARTIFLTDERTESIFVSIEGTVINFPSRPTKVILGSKGAFVVDYIEDDLAITALRPGVRSNLYVYIDNRRFGFNLKAVSGGGDEIVLVRDSNEKMIKANIKYE